MARCRVFGSDADRKPAQIHLWRLGQNQTLDVEGTPAKIREAVASLYTDGPLQSTVPESAPGNHPKCNKPQIPAAFTIDREPIQQWKSKIGENVLFEIGGITFPEDG